MKNKLWKQIYDFRMILNGFEKHCPQVDLNISNVLAGVIQTDGIDLSTAKVVVLSTGTKHIDADALYDKDASLPDTHAEVVARRCLQYYFYEQLELFLNQSIYWIFFHQI